MSNHTGAMSFGGTNISNMLYFYDHLYRVMNAHYSNGSFTLTVPTNVNNCSILPADPTVARCYSYTVVDFATSKLKVFNSLGIPLSWVPAML